MRDGSGRLIHKTRRLKDLFNDMDVVRAQNGVANLVRGMLIEPAEKIDNTFADVRLVELIVLTSDYDVFLPSQDIVNHLFEDGVAGLDLIALNIQRGRDHGLPGYVQYRETCQVGNGKAASFDDLRTNISPEVSPFYVTKINPFIVTSRVDFKFCKEG